MLRPFRAFLQRYPRSYILSLGVAFCFFASMHVLAAPLPLYVTHLGGDAVDVGLASGLFAGFALLARAPVGWLADRTRRWWLLLAGCGIYLLSALGYLAAASVPAVLAIRAFHGMGISIFTTGYTALAADLSPADRRGEALGLAGTAGPVAMLLAPALGDWIRLRFGYSPAFFLAALSALAGIALLWGLPRGSGYAPQRPPAPPDQAGRMGFVLGPTSGLFICGFTFAALYAFMPTFAVERNQVTAAPFFIAFPAALIGA